MSAMNTESWAKNPALWSNSAYHDTTANETKSSRMRLGDPDMFLKLMCTELKHQDPTNPADAKEMQSALASFATVEQLSSIGNNIEKMMGNMRMAQINNMTNLVGKDVLIDMSSQSLDPSGKARFEYFLPEEAGELKLTIVNNKGFPVAYLDGGRNQGEHSILWNGLGIDGKQVPDGVYDLQIVALNKKSQRMAIDQVLRVHVEEVRPLPGGEDLEIISNIQGNRRAFKMSQVKGLMMNKVSNEAKPQQPGVATPKVATAENNPKVQEQNSVFTGIPIEDPLGQELFGQ